MNNTTQVTLDDSKLDEWYYYEEIEWEGSDEHNHRNIASIVVLFATILLGAVCNIAAMIIVIRRRLWRQHEGYLYILAISIGNIAIIVVPFFSHLLWLFGVSPRLETTNVFSCKMWHFLVPVFYSTGWYVSALLFNVYLRSHLTNGTGCNCWQRFASKCCSVSGSLIVNGILTGCFVVMNCWTLWAAELVEGGHEYYCLSWDHENLELLHWEYVSAHLQWSAPFLVLIPVLWGLAFWSQRKQGVGFSFISLKQDDQNSEAREFSRLALIVGAAVFVTQFPMIVTVIYSHHSNYDNVVVVYTVVLLLFTTTVSVMPICCFVACGRLRQELRSALRSCCPRNVNSRNDDVNRILPLESIQQPTV